MTIDIAAIDLEYPGSCTGFVPGAMDFNYGDHLQLLWTAREADAYTPPSDLTVSECADQHWVLQAGISRNPGPWRTDYTPYLRQVMDAYNIPSARHIVFCAGTQLGKTETVYNIL